MRNAEIDIENIQQSPELALFLGMFVGDGCLTIGHDGYGYRTYPVVFVNIRKDLVDLFSNLFLKIFKIEGSIFVQRRQGKKDLWYFQKCHKVIHEIMNENMEMPLGKKCYSVRVPSFISSGSSQLRRHFLLGYMMTDGGVKKEGTIMIHTASKALAYDLRQLISLEFDIERNVKEYIQKERFRSYQLTLNKADSNLVLSQLPSWHNLVMR